MGCAVLYIAYGTTDTEIQCFIYFYYRIILAVGEGDQPVGDLRAQGVRFDIADRAGSRGEFRGEMLCRQIQPDPDDGGDGAVAFIGEQLGEDPRDLFAVDIDIVDPLDQRLFVAEGCDRLAYRYRGDTGQPLDIRFDLGDRQAEGHVQSCVLGGVEVMPAPAASGGLVTGGVEVRAVGERAAFCLVVGGIDAVVQVQGNGGAQGG